LLPLKCDVPTSKLIQEATSSKVLSQATPQAGDLLRRRIAKRLVGTFQKAVKQTKPGHDGDPNAASSITPNTNFREEILIFTTWSYCAGAGRAEAFLLNPQPLTVRTAHEWGVVSEVVPNGKALSRARELAELYLKAPEVTRRNTRVHFIQPLKERIVREVGYGLSLERAQLPILSNRRKPRVNPSPRKENPHEERRNHLIRSSTQADAAGRI
jgi:hypothetical protein